MPRKPKIRSLLDEHEVPNTLDQLGLGPFPQVGGHLFYLLLIEAVATIIRAVQVEDGLRDRAAPRGFLLRPPHGRAEADGIELPPVVAQGGLEVGRVLP